MTTLGRIKLMERADPMEVSLLFRQLATSVRVGLPLVTAIDLQREQMREGLLRDILQVLGTRLREGSTVAEALTLYPKVFPSVYVEIIRGGERAGNLEETLRRCALYIEKEQETLKKVKQGLIYPGFIFFGAIGVIVVLVTVVLPAMTKMFTSFGGNLPAPTRFLLAVVAFTNAYGMYLGVGVLLGAVGLYFYLRTPGGILQRDHLFFRLPALGKLVQEASMASFARMLAVLLQSAVPMGEIMEILPRTSGNRYFLERLNSVLGMVLAGDGLAVSLGRSGVFTSLMLQIIRVGEEAGHLGTALEEGAGYYEAEVDATLKTVLALLEPILILVVGSVVGFIAIAVIMPMYTIMGSIH